MQLLPPIPPVAVWALIIASTMPAADPATDAKQGDASDPQAQVQPPADERYKIGPGDVLDIRVFDKPELSRPTVRVDGAGVIRMPLLDEDIEASCRTEAELAAEIQDRYKILLVEPHVDVFVVKYSSQPVAVTGAVLQPSSFQLERRVRLRELLTLAGGPKEEAGAYIQILRDENAPVCESEASDALPVMVEVGDEPAFELPPTEAGMVTVELQALMRGIQGANPYIRPGDLVNVPPADHVFVVGNVYKPSTLPLTEPLTLSRAIAMAGGILPQTNRDKVRIIRRDPETLANSQMVFNLKDIERTEGLDPTLQAGDIVQVSRSGAKIFLRTMMMASAQMSVWLPLTIIR